MTDLNKLISLLQIPSKISIISHRNPDGDAIGSSLALYQILLKMTHSPKVIFPSEYPAFYKWMPHLDTAIIADLDLKKAHEWIEKSDLIFCLDFNSLDRVDNLSECVTFAKGKKVLIDHHQDMIPFADFIYSKVEASSTAEMVYDWIEMINKLHFIDGNVSDSLLTGIITDTGSFKYNVNPRVFNVVSDLLNRDADYEGVQTRIYNSQSQKQLDLLGHCIANRMKLLDGKEASIIYLSKADFKDFQIGRGDTEGIVNYPLTVEKIKFSTFVTDQSNIIKFSFRSKGNIPVNELARDHFNGGGHINAAGGYMHTSLNKAMTKLEEVIPPFMKKYN